nr:MULTISPECIES: hypothetical protein [unclassified Agrobacterium]
MLAEKKTFHAGPCRKTLLRPEEKLVGRDERPLVARKPRQGPRQRHRAGGAGYFRRRACQNRCQGTDHFYNIVEGTRWDFTFSQFDIPVGYQDRLASRTEAMATITPLQYAYLSACIRKALGHG